MNFNINFLSSLRGIFAVLLIIIVFSCAPKKFEIQEFSIEREGQIVAVINAELAKTAEQRRQGLMNRKSLNDGEGMLFFYERDEVMSFWMKNTLIPLSIAFITSDGRIVDIKDMYPNDTNSVVSNRSVRYALEVPQGWFSRAGVKLGDILNLRIAIID
jgi:uncharacterized membrane protein (UPF0127 family)